MVFHDAGGSEASFVMQIPKLDVCRAPPFLKDVHGNRACLPFASRTHPFAIQQLKMGTSRWGMASTFREGEP